MKTELKFIIQYFETIFTAVYELIFYELLASNNLNFRMTEYATLDWDNDEILRRPSELDMRVEQLLAEAPKENSEQSVTSPSSFLSTPSSSIGTVASSVSSVATSEKDVPKSTTTKIPWKQVEKPIKVPKGGDGPVNASDKIRRQAKTKWESPEDKIRKYEDLKQRYFTQKVAYEDRFRRMKTMVRNIKATEKHTLPPREETINLFEQVRTFHFQLVNWKKY